VIALLTLVHVFVCLVLIAAVLLQSGKAADLAGAFGGGGSSTSFGPRGTATILAKLTTACAILFMVTSFGLWMLGSKQSGSVLKDTGPGAKAPAAQTSTTTPPAKKEQPAAAPATKAPETSPAPVQKSEPAKK
jgi:preprotein translocase subunit SecG